MSDMPVIGPESAAGMDRSRLRGDISGHDGKHSGGGFENFLSEFGPDASQARAPEFQEDSSAADHDRLHRIRGFGGELDLASSGPWSDPTRQGEFQSDAAGETPAESGGKTSAVMIDLSGHPSALAPKIAEELATMLDGALSEGAAFTSASVERAPGARIPAGFEARRVLPDQANTASSATIGANASSSGRALPAFSITRQETHFGPAGLLRDGHVPKIDTDPFPGMRAPSPGSNNALSVNMQGKRLASRADALPFMRPGLPQSENSKAGRASAGALAEGMKPGLLAGGMASAGAPPWSDEADPGLRTGQAEPLLRPEAPHMKGAPGPVRVMHIQLQPTELGQIEMRMRAVNGALEIHIEASRRETFTLLQQDHDLISSILRKIGQPVEAVTISIGERAGAESTLETNGQTSPDERMGAMADHAGGRNGCSGDKSPSRAMEGQERAEVEDDQNPAVLALRHAGSLYL